jgi:hypothetical protein
MKIRTLAGAHGKGEQLMITNVSEFFGDDDRQLIVGNELLALLAQFIGRSRVAGLFQTDVELGILSFYGRRYEKACEEQGKDSMLFHVFV